MNAGLSQSRRFQFLLFGITCAAMAAPPLFNHFRSSAPLPWPLFDATPAKHDLPEDATKNKDYPLWYFVGRTVVEDGTLRERTGRDWPLYPTEPGAVFPFMYPPFAALLLGGLSLLGPTGMILALIALNALSFAIAIELLVRQIGGNAPTSIWLRIVPCLYCFFFLNDMFLLGQPNLGLMVLILGGLMLDRAGKGGIAGILFALAAAIKAFPVVIAVYLLYRFRWKALISMFIGLALFLFVVPGSIRGFERNNAELKSWLGGMLKQDENGYGQRPQQSVGWRNQSLFAVAGRLIGEGDAKAEESLGEPQKALLVSLFHADAKTARYAGYIGCAVLGLAFAFHLPKKSLRTPATDSAEFGSLLILMTIGTPYAFTYYFVWLLVPIGLLVHRASEPGLGRRFALGLLIGIGLLFGVGAPVFGNYFPLACGSLFWASMLALIGCFWILRTKRIPREIG